MKEWNFTARFRTCRTCFRKSKIRYFVLVIDSLIRIVTIHFELSWSGHLWTITTIWRVNNTDLRNNCCTSKRRPSSGGCAYGMPLKALIGTFRPFSSILPITLPSVVHTTKPSALESAGLHGGRLERLQHLNSF